MHVIFCALIKTEGSSVQSSQLCFAFHILIPFLFSSPNKITKMARIAALVVVSNFFYCLLVFSELFWFLSGSVLKNWYHDGYYFRYYNVI